MGKVKKYKKESDFQRDLKKEIETRFQGSIVMKNDPSFFQGVPDLTILYNDRWATLEVKVSEDAAHQPNQDHYVELMHGMSFSSFIFPENKEEVLDALERSFKA